MRSILVAALALSLAWPAIAAPSGMPRGALDDAVTPATVSDTICKLGWTHLIRPPAAYTSFLKRQQLRAIDPGADPRDYVEDHLIPLSLGGAPDDPANLWPQPRAESRLKDRAERALNRAVCAGRLSLSDAQAMIATDWRSIPVPPPHHGR